MHFSHLLVFALLRSIKAFHSPVLVTNVETNYNLEWTQDEFSEIAKEWNLRYTLVVFEETNVFRDLPNCTPSNECSIKLVTGDDCVFYDTVENPMEAITDPFKVQNVEINEKGGLISFDCEVADIEIVYVVQGNPRGKGDKCCHIANRVTTMTELSKKLVTCSFPPIFFFINKKRSEGVGFDINWKLLVIAGITAVIAKQY